MEAVLFLIVTGCAVAGFVWLGRISRRISDLQTGQTELLQRMDFLTSRIGSLKTDSEVNALSENAAPVLQVPLASVAVPARPSVKPPPVPLQVEAISDAPPPVAAPPPYDEDLSGGWEVPRSRLAESVHETLLKIWNWILVGEEHRKPGVSAEVAIASTWLLRLFVLALGGFVASFIALSIRNNLLPPWVRIIFIMVGGAALIFAGIRLLGRRYSLIGHGLMAGGILVLYLASYAAGPYYGIFDDHSASASFAMMVAVSVVSAVLAVRKDSLLSAVLGIAGGFGAPLILKTAEVDYGGLYGYLLILNLAIVCIAMKKEWRLLNYLAFILTYLLFAVSLWDYRTDDFLLVIIFLVLLFVVHSSLVFIRNLIDEKESTALEVLHMTANALLFAYFAYSLIDERFGRPYPAVLTSLLAVFYSLHAYIFLRKSLVDKPLMMGFSGLACLFIALTLPIAMDKGSLTMSYSLLALMFLWVGRKIESNFIQSMGGLLYVVVFIRLVGGLGTDFDPNPARKMAFDQYLPLMVKRLFTYGVSVASFIGACILQKSRIGVRHDFAVTLENDTPEVIKRSVASDILYWVGVLTGFMFLLLELNSVFSYYVPVRQTALTALWAGMGLYFLWSYTSFRKRDSLVVSAINAFAAVALIKLLLLDLAGWRLNHRWVYGVQYDYLDAGMRAMDFAVVITLFGIIWKVMRRRKSWTPTGFFGYAGVFMLLIYATLELNSLLYFKLRAFQDGGISVLWALFAVIYVLIGIRKDLKLLRYAGLALFAVVAVKVVTVDLASMEIFYRMLAFLVIALALLGGSFAYIQSGSRVGRSGIRGRGRDEG